MFSILVNALCFETHRYSYYTLRGNESGHSMVRTAVAHGLDVGFMVPTDYCAEFVASVARANPNLGPPNARPWAMQYKDYSADYFHLLCVQEYAYRPMRAFSQSLSMKVF